jgi:hypothetical protein
MDTVNHGCYDIAKIFVSSPLFLTAWSPGFLIVSFLNHEVARHFIASFPNHVVARTFYRLFC